MKMLGLFGLCVALCCLFQAAYAQEYLERLYIVHDKEFNSASLSPLTENLPNLSPKAFLYNSSAGGCRIALEKPGSWRGMVDIGSQISTNLPQMELFTGDVVRIHYSGGNDTNSDGPVSALLGVGYFGGGGIEAAPGAAIVADGKRRTYDFLVPENGNGKRLTALYVTVNSPGPGGGEFTLYKAEVLRKPIDNRIDADNILKNPPKHDVKVGKHNGAMTVLVDNKPFSTLGWACMINHNISDDAIKTMLKDTDFPCARLMITLGQHMLGYYPTTWLGPDQFDWSYVDQQVGRILSANPESKIILQVALDGALWWVRMHPEAAGIDSKGMIPDYLSEEWRRDSRDAVRQMIAHIQTSPYAEAIIGYQLMNGSTLDCNYEVNTSTPKAIKRFQSFLKTRYKTVELLRKAWGDSVVTFDTAKPELLLESQGIKNANDPYALLFAPGKHRRIADSQDFATWSYDQVALDFCKFVKEATHNRVIAGARTGNMLSGGWGPENLGGGRVHNYINSPHFDYFEQWEPYPGRGIGYYGSGASIYPVQGLADFNKMVMLQNDVRPHTGPDMGYGATKNLAETVVLQRRVFMNSMIMGQMPYLWQMSYNYHIPELTPLWKEQTKLYDRMLKSDRRTGAEIAYVCDSDYAKYLGWDPLKSDPTRGFSLLDYPRFLWARAGVPYDVVLLDKLDKCKDYKVYVFFLTFGLSDAQRKTIDQVVNREGKTAIYLWADGFIDGKGVFNQSAMSKLVGMNLTASTKPRSWRMVPSEWFAAKTKIASDTPMGTLVNNEPCEPMADKNTYSPSFVVSDPTSKAIAYYEGTKDVAIAEKKSKGYSSIYCASMNLVPSVVRYALKNSGGHIYTDTEDICYINNSFIGLHTKQTGNINIVLPKPSALYDVYNDKELASSKNFTVPVESLETYLFYRGTKEEWNQR